MAKAQVFSIDFIVAATVLVMSITVIAFFWSYSFEKHDTYHYTKELRVLARDISSALVTSPGIPRNWSGETFSTSTVQSIGLAAAPWILSETRIDALAHAPYNSTKTALGIIGPNYEYALEVRVFNGTGYALRDTIGLPPTNATYVLVQERHALLNRNYARLTLKVWKQ